MQPSHTKELFPLGIATGAAFCNRETERAALKSAAGKGAHTWIWARRRLGKTSLVQQTLLDLARARPVVHAINLDCNLVHDADSLEHMVRRAAAELSLKLMPRGRKQAQNRLSRAFKGFEPSFSLGVGGFAMTLKPADAPAPGIADVLLALDRAAGSVKRRAVVVFDEFQQVSRLTHGRADISLEGGIRHAVERAKHVTYIFTGSERRLLEDMFENPDRPLYHHCQKLTLERIDAQDYERFLNRACQARWRRALPQNTVALILKLSDRLPHYVNQLCRRLWQERKAPTPEAVELAWRGVVEDATPTVAQRVSSLSATQRALLLGIAREGVVAQPTSRQFLNAVRLSASTGSDAKQVLEGEDLIRQDRDGWRVIDPVMRSYLSVS